MIVLYARPQFHFSTREDWTQITIDGDTEPGISNIITASLLAAKFEVDVTPEESDEQPEESDE